MNGAPALSVMTTFSNVTLLSIPPDTRAIVVLPCTTFSIPLTATFLTPRGPHSVCVRTQSARHVRRRPPRERTRGERRPTSRGVPLVGLADRDVEDEPSRNRRPREVVRSRERYDARLSGAVRHRGHDREVFRRGSG